MHHYFLLLLRIKKIRGRTVYIEKACSNESKYNFFCEAIAFQYSNQSRPAHTEYLPAKYCLNSPNFVFFLCGKCCVRFAEQRIFPIDFLYYHHFCLRSGNNDIIARPVL